ncbi:MAG: PIN domain-containing protein [Candidatus Eremiobacterota bacterium]
MSTLLAVTDTHALIWYAQQRRRRLGRHARRLFEEADAGRAVIYVPTVALVEVFDAARKGLIELANGTHTWVRNLLACGSFVAIDLTVEIVLAAEQLYDIPERMDRLIAATAVHLETPLITRDPEIASMAGLQLLW